ncbi:biotin-dependent carboxyltransferase family protein [Paenarthrobacter sp. NPDC091711]|uniref:5-oxoprolinase subunit C family protein n=1 Tax=Paenarthrobacter sp. NPDC091711 TaxID=3364385 RepID=UPI0038082906
MPAELTIKKSGMAVVTDLGRHATHLGQSTNGALDQFAARVANTLVGNEHNAPLIEMTLADFRMTADSDLLIAVTGAMAEIRIDGVLRSSWETMPLMSGQLLEIQQKGNGLRNYLSVSGNLQVPMLLGSCAPDTLIGFGTHLSDGARVGARHNTPLTALKYMDVPLARPDVPLRPQNNKPVVTVTEGPDYHEFGASIRRLFEEKYTVGARSNHIGMRLQGRVPVRQTIGELLSTGVPLGAVEVPSEDELLVLHRGRGVTAGYAVPAVVTAVGLDILAQSRPGDLLTFEMVETREALERVREQHRQLKHLRSRMEIILRGHGISPAWDIESHGSPPRAHSHFATRRPA